MGQVDLGVVEDATLVAEVERMSTYTWEFRNSIRERDSEITQPDKELATTLTDGGDGSIKDAPPPG